MEERRNSNSIGRRNDDGTCMLHHQMCKSYDDCLVRMREDLQTKVGRWVVVGAISISVSAFSLVVAFVFAQMDGLHESIEYHNVTIRDIAVKQGAVMANQERIIEVINRYHQVP